MFWSIQIFNIHFYWTRWSSKKFNKNPSTQTGPDLRCTGPILSVEIKFSTLAKMGKNSTSLRFLYKLGRSYSIALGTLSSNLGPFYPKMDPWAQFSDWPQLGIFFILLNFSSLLKLHLNKNYKSYWHRNWTYRSTRLSSNVCIVFKVIWLHNEFVILIQQKVARKYSPATV